MVIYMTHSSDGATHITTTTTTTNTSTTTVVPALYYAPTVEVNGLEYSFAGGVGIFCMTPKQAPGAVYRESIELGRVSDGPTAIARAIELLRPMFGPNEYHILNRNCNHFAHQLSVELVGKGACAVCCCGCCGGCGCCGWDKRVASHPGILSSPPPSPQPHIIQYHHLHKPKTQIAGIPSYTNRLASFGSFFSCFLPRELTQEAPVNQDPSTGVGMYVGNGNGGGNYRAFSGEGQRAATSGGGRAGGSGGGGAAESKESEAERREKIRQATLARMASANAGANAASSSAL
jgi:uncharacterized membrane protein YgcG